MYREDVSLCLILATQRANSQEIKCNFKRSFRKIRHLEERSYHAGMAS